VAHQGGQVTQRGQAERRRGGAIRWRSILGWWGHGQRLA